MPDFNGSSLVITLDSGVTEVDWKSVFSSWKDWQLSSPVNRGFPPAFDSDGGNPLNAIINQGSYYFLRNELGWRIKPPEENITIYATGNLAVRDSSLPAFIETTGAYTAAILGLQPITQGVTPVMGEQLAYASFQGAVWVDVTSIYSDAGTDSEPNGNVERPVNNIVLAVAIANDQGFRIIQVIGDLTLTTGDDVREFKLIGVSHINSVLTVETGALCLETSFESFDMTGVLDGDSEITNCIVRDLEYFNGHIHDSYLAGTIKLRGSLQANISNCAILDVLDPPIIDAGGSGQNLMMPNFSGNVVLDNLTGASQLGIGIDAGRVTINSTCTSGIITIGGSGEVIDNSGAGCYVVDTAVDGTDVNNIQYLIESMNQHHTGYGKVIFWDAYSGNDTFDGAHPKRATKTFAQAHTLADDNGHDIILALAGDPTGVTTVNEQIVISKNYTFLRGPGRDFIINGTNDLLAAIDITGVGVEISGLRISTNTTNTIAAIKATGGFPLLKDLYIENSANGILADDGEHGFIDNVRIGHNTGYAVTISGGSDHFVIKNSHFGTNAGGGVIVGLTSGHEVTIKDTVIHGNTGYGIDILSGSSHTQILGSVSLFGNTLGDVRDLGANTTDNSNSDSNIKTVTSDVDFLKNIEGGRWDLVSDQMIFYADDNVTEVARFDMFDSAGNPTTTGDIFKRTRV